jgi:hypothetical protein
MYTHLQTGDCPEILLRFLHARSLGVTVEYTPNGGSASTRAEYRYNGLNWRIAKPIDSDADGDLDQEQRMYYDANCQPAYEQIDDKCLNRSQ